ncbi:MAG: hypothetical protein JXA69_20110 [Phycisphaerae bacterium]|nr:hypothetical protein [Phycisphaerae bacterium]
MKVLSLNGTDWRLIQYWRKQWALRAVGEMCPLHWPVRPPFPATVPGAVQHDLRAAGVLPDWNAGLNSQACEWVNNRDWAFQKDITVPPDFDGMLTLECDGLDYAGQVSINGALVGTFEGTHLRHEFDLTGKIAPGETALLEILVFAAPDVDGTFGYTSQTRIFKPRFGYCWDWSPRVVNVGIWQDVRLVSRGPSRLRDPLVRATLGEDGQSGRLAIAASVEGPARSLAYTLSDAKGRTVASGEAAVADGRVDHQCDLDNVQPWWPATHGEQPLYRLEMTLPDGSGGISDHCVRTIGFKRIRWLPNPGAPPDARPYICEVNGVPVFLRGVNWVPPSPFYGAVSRERYETLIRLYRNMNANILRVWGGAILERPEFYETCDRLGLLVWQEFPLSSSGIENWPPEDPDVITSLRRIAEEYIRRRGHHVSHLLWCGGNELQGTIDGQKTGGGKPVDESHPCMRMFAEVVERLDPGKRLLPTSPTGPRFFAERKDFDKGLHHHTHGPWSNLPLAARYDYFNNLDSLFLSETGAPGCSTLEWLQQNCGEESVWPPRAENPYWLHPAAPWLPWDDVVREYGAIDDDASMLPFVVKASRYLQAESYRYAAEAARRRAMTCSGFIIWMGHDNAHCTSNNSAIELPGWPKPAYAWLQRAFASPHVSLRHDQLAYRPGETLRAEVWAHYRAGAASASGRVTARLLSVTGDVYETTEWDVTTQGHESLRCGYVEWVAPDARHALLIVDLTFELAGQTVRNRYLLSQAPPPVLAPLRALPATALSVRELRSIDRHRKQLVIRNDGKRCAVGVELVTRAPAHTLLTDTNHLLVLPGETVEILFEVLPSHWAGTRRARDRRLRVEWFNAKAALPVSMKPRG